MFGEDLSVGELFRSPGHVISEEECVHFATQWDPLDIHTSPREADQGWHDGLIVSGLHALCLHQAVMAREETHSWSIVGGTKLGVRFSRPVRPGDRLEVTATMIEATRRAVRGVDANRPLVHRDGAWTGPNRERSARSRDRSDLCALVEC